MEQLCLSLDAKDGGFDGEMPALGALCFHLPRTAHPKVQMEKPSGYGRPFDSVSRAGWGGANA